MSQQPLLVTAATRAPLEEQQPLPPRNAGSVHGGNQQQIIPNQTVHQQEHQHTSSTNM